jgi:hypothetical protein
MIQHERVEGEGVAILEQATLTPRADVVASPEIVVIRSAKQVNALLFEGGYKKLVGVSYVASLSFIEELFARGYDEIELVVGENLGEAYQNELKGKDIETATRMAQRVRDGKLRLYFPVKTPDHSKFYVLSKPGRASILLGSANLTENTKRVKMANTMAVWDLPERHPFVVSMLKKYENENRKHCALFMGDLVEELRARTKPDRTDQEIVEAWLARSPEVEEESEAVAVMAELAEQALSPERNEVPIIVIDLPKNEKAANRLIKFFGPLNPERNGAELRLNGLDFGKHVFEKWRVPMMRLDLSKRIVSANVRGVVEELTAPLAEPAEVNAALVHIEDYVNTVDLGVTSNPLLAKQSMFEALLYFLASPFANERMRLTRERHGAVTRRGPQVLYITGPSSNGKTAFVKFALKLITGHNFEPVDGQNSFTKTQVKSVRSLHTVFPMVFDDVPANKPLEGVIKPYWETEWRSDLVFPQLIITSNAQSLKEWAKTRVKLVQFDVHFTESKENKDRLSQLLARDNPIFKWFSHEYFQGMETEEFLADDQLRLARSVMRGLYARAGRKMPEFFVDRPLEEIYDPGKAEWMRLLQLCKVTLSENGSEAVIDFAPDFEPREIGRYEGHLPQEIKHKRAGKSLIVQNPAALFEWIAKEGWPPKVIPASAPSLSPPKTSFFSNLFGRKR